MPIPLALKPNMIYLTLLATIKIDKLEKNQLHAPCFKMVGNLALALDVSRFQGVEVFITSLSIVRVHGVIVPIIYCLVFFSFKNVRLDCSLMPTTLNDL